MSSIERTQVKLPPQFDQTKVSHVEAVIRKVEEAHGEGFELESVDPVTMIATFMRTKKVSEITDGPSGIKQVRLPDGTRASDGEKYAARYADTFPGFELTTFEPHVGRAILKRLTPEVKRVREATAAALRVKPWDIQVNTRRGGGYTVNLHPGFQSSRDQSKLEEVATTVAGRDGWYVDADPAKLIAHMIPASPPTFPAAAPTPMPATVEPFNHTNKEHFKIPLGIVLPAPGQDDYETFYLDGNAAQHLQLGGVTGSGKDLRLDARIPVPVSDRFPDGWALNADLQVGNLVFSPDGRETAVTGFGPIRTENVFEVEFSDGQIVECSGSHLWKVSTDHSRRVHTPRLAAGRNAKQTKYTRRSAELRRLAAKVPVGTVDTLLNISELAGFHRNAVTQMCLPLKHLATLAKVPIQRRATVFDADALVRSLTQTPARFRGEPLDGQIAASRGVTGRMTMRQISGALMLRPATRNEQSATSVLLRKRGITGVEGTTDATLTVYPVDEVLRILADRVDFQSTRSCSGREVVDLETVVDTRTMLNNVKRTHAHRDASNYAVRLTQPITGEHRDLQVDPYVLGVWLGDGSRWHTGCITSEDQEIVDEIVSAGYPIHRIEKRDDNGAASQYHFAGLRKSLASAGFVAYTHRSTPAVKRIPAVYRRASYEQRLALLQGLMDTDGTIGVSGTCDLTLADEDLIMDALELVRSLGIRCTTPERRESGYTLDGVRHPGAGRWRLHFTTDQRVFRLSRKAGRLPEPGSLRPTQQWNYVVDVRLTERREKMRCIAVASPEHLYLTDGFIPTHNTVTLNCFIAQWLSRGAELAIIDEPSKAADFEWCKRYVRPGGWGCTDGAHAAVAIELLLREGARRGKIIKEAGVTQWKELPPQQALTPLVVIVDEVTALFAMEAVPKAGRDAPQKLLDMKAEAEMKNFHTEVFKKGINELAAVWRFAGIFLVLATQVASAATGLDPKLRINLPHKILLGSKVNDGAKRLVFADPDRIPEVPGNVQSDPGASRGVGSADPEGGEPVIFKSFYASTRDYSAWLDSLGVPTHTGQEPTDAQIIDVLGDEALDGGGFAAEREEMIERRRTMKDPVAASLPGFDEAGLDFKGEGLSGAAKAAAQSKMLAALRKTQDAEAPAG